MGMIEPTLNRADKEGGEGQQGRDKIACQRVLSIRPTLRRL